MLDWALVPLAVLDHATPGAREFASVLRYNYPREFEEEETRPLNLAMAKVDFIFARLLVEMQVGYRWLIRW